MVQLKSSALFQNKNTLLTYVIKKHLISQSKIHSLPFHITGMYTYNHSAFIRLLEDLIQAQVNAETWNWINQIKNDENKRSWNGAFASMPRKTGKQSIALTLEQVQKLNQIRGGFNVNNWPIDQVCRVYLLLQLNTTSENDYINHIESLFLAAEMNELVALYAALPVLAYPERWKKRCAEGIRSNIGAVLETIICNNPYPSEYLDEPAWNQLVLKAFFTEKPINQIIGLDKRSNQALANTLSDYAHERWAASRPVHPLIWRCVYPFVNDQIFPDIERLALSLETKERMAAALVCSLTTYAPAKQLLNTNTQLKNLLPDLTWEKLGD